MLDSIRQALERGFYKEAQSYIRYLFYAQKARMEADGAAAPELKNALLEASALYRQLAEDEFKHAFYYLTTLDEIQSTLANLDYSVQAELSDQAEYSMSAGAARALELEDIARHFLRIADDEKYHAHAAAQLKKRLEELQPKL